MCMGSAHDGGGRVTELASKGFEVETDRIHLSNSAEPLAAVHLRGLCTTFRSWF